MTGLLPVLVEAEVMVFGIQKRLSPSRTLA
jgi:hypothetical protein